MTEEALDPEKHIPHWFERWTMSQFEGCGCKGSYDDPDLPEGSGPHDFWRHPIGMPLITCSIVFGLAPEGWSTMVKDGWSEGFKVKASLLAVLFFCLWLLGGVGFVFFTALFALATPLRWFSKKVFS
jgi:hypothetical protein